MVWQDVALGIAQWCFIISLLPSVFGKDKPAIMTSAITTATQLVQVAVFVTLEFWGAAASSLILGILWATLGFQKFSSLSGAEIASPEPEPEQ